MNDNIETHSTTHPNHYTLPLSHDVFPSSTPSATSQHLLHESRPRVRLPPYLIIINHRHHIHSLRLISTFSLYLRHLYRPPPPTPFTTDTTTETLTKLLPPFSNTPYPRLLCFLLKTSSPPPHISDFRFTGFHPGLALFQDISCDLGKGSNPKTSQIYALRYVLTGKINNLADVTIPSLKIKQSKNWFEFLVPFLFQSLNIKV
ncbi:unnamed protein product [Lactuca saligna]|uniref:Uncharacterized protein n=1 Tax=Lactuca saligna TaxID=75948 RepID=A0AA36EJV0_LACSI|nr:unnamed protein product [Lactuca saligna]